MTLLLRYLVVPFLCLPLLVQAGTEAKSSLWLMSLSNFKFTGNGRGFLDIQPRFAIDDIRGGDDGEIDTILLRGGLGYQLAPNITLYQGYAYIPTYDPRRVEHRSFQQLSIKQPLSKGIFSHRLRLEQRFLEKIDDTAYRFRYFGRLVYPLTSWHPKLSLAVNEELFVNLNDADDTGPQSGFNQNRLFVGLNYRIKPSLAYEFGIQNQFVNRRGGKDNVSNNILFFGVQTSF